MSAPPRSDIVAALREGRHADARAAAEAALAAGERDDALLGLAAMLAARSGDANAAAGHLTQLVARRPEDQASRLNLSQALIALDRFDDASALLAESAATPARDRLAAFVALRLGDLATAATSYRRVLAERPDDVDSWANLASAESLAGAHDAAIAAAEEAITRRRGDARLYLALCEILERADRPEPRQRVAREAAALAPDDPRVLLTLGRAEWAENDVAAAEGALRRALEIAPADAEICLELGLLLETGGRFADLEALIAEAQASVGEELALLQAWSALRGGRIEAAAAWAARIPASVRPYRAAHVRALIAERADASAAAFAQFAEMNRFALAEAPPLPGPSYRQRVEAQTSLLQAIPMQRPRPRILDTPIFITGFPRSGTTLLDVILSRLAGHVVLEEPPMLARIEQAIGGAAAALALTETAAEEWRARYHTELAAIAPDHAGRRPIDKHPLHMGRMPLVDRLFPGAPVLLVERHPYDVVLSCFMAGFRLTPAMRSFADLEEAARTYDAVWQAWDAAEARLPLSVHRVRYERLVTDPQREVCDLLGFLGVLFDPVMLDTVSAARARGRIATASYAQVREPIHARSVARWQRYRPQLAPVLPILAPWAERLGYET